MSAGEEKARSIVDFLDPHLKVTVPTGVIRSRPNWSTSPIRPAASWSGVVFGPPQFGWWRLKSPRRRMSTSLLCLWSRQSALWTSGSADLWPCLWDCGPGLYTLMIPSGSPLVLTKRQATSLDSESTDQELGSSSFETRNATLVAACE